MVRVGFGELLQDKLCSGEVLLRIFKGFGPWRDGSVWQKRQAVGHERWREVSCPVTVAGGGDQH